MKLRAPTFIPALLMLALAACGTASIDGVPTFGVGNFAWQDEDSDGIQDPGERGVPEVTVNLYFVNADEGTVTLAQSTKTNSDGFYFFDELPEDRYLLEFVPPPDYDFTLMDEGDDDEVDSDADPESGRTDDFQLSSDDDTRDAGLVLRAPPTSTPVPEPTASGTQPGPTATAAQPEETGTYFDDGPNDEARCDSQGSAVDQEVDIRRVLVQRMDGNLWVRVMMAAPLVNDYSFAIVIFISSDGRSDAFIWEIHREKLRIGEVDPQTGELIADVSTGGMEIEIDRSKGEVAFHIVPELLGDPLRQLEVRSFHSPEEGSTTNCDAAGPYNIPEE